MSQENDVNKNETADHSDQPSETINKNTFMNNKIIDVPKDGLRLKLIKYLWGGALGGALTGYTYALTKKRPIQSFVSSYAVTFGISAALYAGISTPLYEKYGRNIYTVGGSGAITGTALGLMLAPKQSPYFILGFTGFSLLAYYGNKGFDFWRKRKGLRIRKERGLLTDEESIILERMNHPFRGMMTKESMPSWLPIKKENRIKSEEPKS
ncbi:hypothetical protein WA158_001846 [Blastocystis sp. Blastoise]